MSTYVEIEVVLLFTFFYHLSKVLDVHEVDAAGNQIASGEQ